MCWGPGPNRSRFRKYGLLYKRWRARPFKAASAHHGHISTQYARCLGLSDSEPPALLSGKKTHDCSPGEQVPKAQPDRIPPPLSPSPLSLSGPLTGFLGPLRKTALGRRGLAVAAASGCPKTTGQAVALLEKGPRILPQRCAVWATRPDRLPTPHAGSHPACCRGGGSDSSPAGSQSRCCTVGAGGGRPGRELN